MHTHMLHVMLHLILLTSSKLGMTVSISQMMKLRPQGSNLPKVTELCRSWDSNRSA